MSTRNIPVNSDLHRDLVARIAERVKMARSQHQTQCEKWSVAEDQVVAYVNETDSDATRRNRRDDGEPQYTTISIPYTYALVMAAHTYWTSVFFARTPVHQFAGRHGEGEMQIQAMESLIDYQVQVGRMLAPYYIWLYDAAKYGVGVIGTWWNKEVIQYSELQQVPSESDPAKLEMVMVTKQVLGYEGHCAYNISPFEFVHDPRVAIGQFQKGEFCYVKKSMSWNDILRWKALGRFMNIEELKTGHAEQNDNSDSTSSVARPEKNRELDGFKLTGLDGVAHPSRVHMYEFHVELTQSEWKLGENSYPEKWVFWITQDLSIILGARPLGEIHGQFPFDVLEPEIEAYAAYNRGIPQIMEPTQNTMDWLLNSHFFNVRQGLNNQFVGDPSKIYMKDVKEANKPGFFFRLKPEAYGTDVRTVITQLPVSDVTRAHMADLETMFSIGEKVLGINDQILGALSGSGRKTATEVRTSTGFGVNRLKTVAEYMSATGFSSHSQKLVQCTQQYYRAEKKLRIVGDAATLAGPQFFNVSPESIVGQYDFVNVDGTLPIDRMAQANLWKEILMLFFKVPMLAQTYDLSKIFAWTAQLGGLKNISQFRLQIGSPTALAQQAAAGNVVPIRPGGPGSSPGAGTGMNGMPNASTQAGLNAMGGAGGGQY